MGWIPPSTGPRDFPAWVILLFLLPAAGATARLGLPPYTDLPLPASLRDAVDAEHPATPAELERERAELRRKLLRRAKESDLVWAMQIDLARGRPEDALRWLERVDASFDGDELRFLAALARFERARKLEDPWQDELDLEAVVHACEARWGREDFGSAAEQLGLWAELGLGNPERAKDRADRVRQPRLWQRVREIELRESGPWNSALDAAGDDRETLRWLFRLRPSLYCWFGLDRPTEDALLALQAGDDARADSLASRVRARVVAIDEFAELGAPCERLLAAWVDARPADRAPLELLREARELTDHADLSAEWQRAVTDILPRLRAAGLEQATIPLNWIRVWRLGEEQPEAVVGVAEEMVDDARRCGDPYLLKEALQKLHSACNNLPDIARLPEIERRWSALTARFDFEPRDFNRANSRAALRVSDYGSAEAFATRQLAYGLRSGDRLYRFSAHVDRSYVELMRDHPKVALEHCDATFGIFASLPVTLQADTTVETELELARIVEAMALLEQGEEAAALERIGRMQSERIGGRQGILLNLLEAQIRVDRGEFDRADVCLARADSLNEGAAFRDYRWRVAHARADLAHREGEPDDALRLYEMAWRNRLVYGADLGAQDLASRFLGGTRDLAEDYFEMAEASGAEPEALLSIDQAERALRWGLDPDALPELQPGELLLQFRVEERRTFIWCVDASGVEMKTLTMGREDWSRLRTEIQPRLVRGEPLPERCTRLFGAELLAALDAPARARRIRVAPASELAMLPWSLLGIDGVPLCATHDFALTPIQRAGKAASSAGKGIAVFAYAGSGREFLLPGVERHAQELADRWPAANYAGGSRATVTAMLEQLAQLRALVLVGHAGAEDDGTPYFQLAEDGESVSRLHPLDLFGLDLSSLECIVLVGCGTARDRSDAPSAPGFGLAGAFLGAGAGSVYASVVPLPDEWNWIDFVDDALRSQLDAAGPSTPCLTDHRFIFLEK